MTATSQIDVPQSPAQHSEPAWLTGDIAPFATPYGVQDNHQAEVPGYCEFQVWTAGTHAEQGLHTTTASDESDSLPNLIGQDHQHFYSTDSLIGLSYGLAGGALMANTHFDETVRAHFQSSIRNASTDEWFDALHAQKEMGNGYYTIPLFATAWAAGELFDESESARTVGEWGERSFRGVLVGAPPMLATQYVIGGARPGESISGSDWKLFNDHNGVSGHAFMGSVPFLTAAQMTEKPWLKAAFYAGSTLVPLSRINDDDHYTSQAFLGWWFAFIATRAVDATQTETSRWRFAPWVTPDSSGFAAEYRF